jgi:hypothetical protein
MEVYSMNIARVSGDEINKPTGNLGIADMSSGVLQGY